MTDLSKSRLHRAGRIVTVLLTNTIKLVGLAAAVKELFLDPNPQPVALALSAFMMAGAQLSEEMILRFLVNLLSFPTTLPPTDRHDDNKR